jgi:hypothetical protein
MSVADCDDYKGGTCRWCGDEGQVFADNDLCEDCDSNVCHCSICDEEQHYQSPCRHLFQDENFEWCGSGCRPDGDGLKQPFFALLRHMPEGFADDLRTAIQSGEFHTWIVAPMIGGGGALYLYGMPDREGMWTLTDWGDALIEIGEGDAAEETVDGYRWLASLYNDKTPDANKTTVAWLDEWLATPKTARTA